MAKPLEKGQVAILEKDNNRIITIVRCNGEGDKYTVKSVNTTDGGTFTASRSDMTLVDSISAALEIIKGQHEKEIVLLSSKQDFLKESGDKEFNPLTWKAWSSIKVANDAKMNDVDKARALRDIHEQKA